MRKGICRQYGKCQMAKDAVVQEIEEGFANFACPVCGHTLDEVVENGDRKAIPAWFIPLIGLIFILTAAATFFLVPKPNSPSPPPPVKPVVVPAKAKLPPKIFFTDIIQDIEVLVQKGSPKVKEYIFGPFQSNLSDDSLYWEAKSQGTGFKIEPDKGYGKSIITKSIRPSGDAEGSITFMVAPVHNGFKGDNIEFNLNFKVKPSTTIPLIRLVSSGPGITLGPRQTHIEIQRQMLRTNPPTPDAIKWKLNRTLSYPGISFEGLAESGSGDIPGFSVLLEKTVEEAKIVFEIVPVKNGFESKKSTYIITLSGTPCPSSGITDSFNKSFSQMKEELDEQLYMISKTKDPVMKNKFIQDVVPILQKVKGISVKVTGFDNFEAFLNSGFNKKPEIQDFKDACGMITGMVMNPK